MRDQHRDKRDLIIEVTGLRKQVADLKQAALERRRIEDGLLQSDELQRALLDAVPAGLCLVSAEAKPVLANRAMALLLGYDSPGELVRIGQLVGLFAPAQDLAWITNPESATSPFKLDFLRKGDGPVSALAVRSGFRAGTGQVIMVLEIQTSHGAELVGVERKVPVTGP
jgi:PAS domain-containing protein